MLVGPVFTREILTTPRGWQLYFSRALYVAALFGLVLTAWLILIGSQEVRSLGDLARFGSAVFAVIAPLQLAMAIAFSALLTAAAVAQEKDRRTLDLLLMTNLNNAELVLGKLLASMLGVLVLMVAAIGLLMLITLLGGVSYIQVVRVVGVTLMAALAAGSLGSTLALWREKSFQTLAMTALVIVLWLLGGEVLASGVLGQTWRGVPVTQWAAGLTPLRAIYAAMEPFPVRVAGLSGTGGPVYLFMLVTAAIGIVLNAIAIAWVRAWNPARELQPQTADKLALPRQTELPADRPDPSLAGQPSSGASLESTKNGPGERVHAGDTKIRHVWDNPILWREICTWAYGKKIIVVRVSYLVVFAICALALVAMLGEDQGRSIWGAQITPAARPVVALIVVGLVLVNALAVTSLTGERDIRALDLLLVTDLTAKEIVFGKLGGIFFNAKEMILLPIVLAMVLWATGRLGTENMVFLTIGLLVLDTFVAILGIHAGMTYANSRTAVAVSLGTVLFLLLGIAICMRMMVAFQSSFSYQLQAFSAFMVGGGIGLYCALGIRNPSPAIGWASFLAPFATFFVITSYLDQNYGSAFLVAVATYGFAIMALLVPAIYEFDVATGRTTGGE